MGSASRAPAGPARDRHPVRAGRGARPDRCRLEGQIPPRQSGKAMASVRDQVGGCKKKAPVRRFLRYANRGVLAGRGGKGGMGAASDDKQTCSRRSGSRFLKKIFHPPAAGRRRGAYPSPVSGASAGRVASEASRGGGGGGGGGGERGERGGGSLLLLVG